jgi:hypothetical protein
MGRSLPKDSSLRAIPVAVRGYRRACRGAYQRAEARVGHQGADERLDGGRERLS